MMLPTLSLPREATKIPVISITMIITAVKNVDFLLCILITISKK
jgi:hypothetical protein